MTGRPRPFAPTSQPQFTASAERRLANIERVRSGIVSVPLQMSGTYLPYSFAYLIRDAVGGVHVVDPGSALAENRERLWRAIDDVGGDVASIIVTHLHSDHLGLATALHEETGARIFLHEAELAAMAYEATEPGRTSAMRSVDSWGVPPDRHAEIARLSGGDSVRTPPASARLLVRGDIAELDVPGVVVAAMLTPGHTAGSIVLRLPEAGVLLTGDLVLPHINVGIGLGGSTGRNPLTDYLNSLGTVAAFDDDEVLPGHGYRFVGLAERVSHLRNHIIRRAGQVRHATDEVPGGTVWEIASRVGWTAGWENLHDFFLLSALRQTEMYLDFITHGGLDPHLA